MAEVWIQSFHVLQLICSHGNIYLKVYLKYVFFTFDIMFCYNSSPLKGCQYSFREASVQPVKFHTVNPLLLLYLFDKNKRVKAKELRKRTILFEGSCGLNKDQNPINTHTEVSLHCKVLKLINSLLCLLQGDFSTFSFLPAGMNCVCVLTHSCFLHSLQYWLVAGLLFSFPPQKWKLVAFWQIT